MHSTKNALIVSVLFWVFSGVSFGERVEDSLEIRLNIAPVYKMSIETFMVQNDDLSSTGSLLEPSKNSVIPGKNLNGVIDLGHLIARKQGNEILPLVSEYKVMMRVECETNHNRAYVLTQRLDAPLTGTQTGEVFPEGPLVSSASLDREKGQERGTVLLQNETPLIPGTQQVIFQSGETGHDYLGNVIQVFFWISDRQSEKVSVSQRADTYRSTLTLTMVEL